MGSRSFRPLAVPGVAALALAVLLAVDPGTLSAPAPPAPSDATAVARPAPAATAERPRGPLSFGATEYDWSLDELTGEDGAELRLLNDASTAADVRVTLGDLDLRGTTKDQERGRSLSNDDAVSLTARDRVPAGGDEAIHVTVNEGVRLASGTYSSWITAIDDATRTVARAAVTLTVPAGIAPRPLVRTLRVTGLRWVPFMNSRAVVYETVVPLDVPASDITADRLALRPGTVLGGLSGSDTGTASVVYNGEIETLPYGLVGAGFDVRLGHGGPGDYTGTLDLLPAADEAGEVEVTVALKDAVLAPILALLAGVLMALTLRRYVGSGRDARVLNARVEELAASAEKAQRAFAEAASGTCWATYAVSDLAERAAAAREVVRRLAANRGIDMLDADRLADVERQLEELKADAEVLQRLDGALRNMDAALKPIVPLAPIAGMQPDADPNRPAFVERALSWRDGEPMTAVQMRKRLADVIDATTLAADWRDLHEQASRAWLRVEDLRTKETTEEEAERLNEATARLSTTWNEMWNEPAAPAVAPARRRSTLHRASAEIASLTAELERRAAAGPEAAAITSLERVTGEAVVPAAPQPPAAPDPAARARAIRDEIERNDLIVKVLALVVAIATGLTALYFGEPFGTPTDYLTAFLWGLTTTSAIDALADAFGLRSAADRLSSPARPGGT